MWCRNTAQNIESFVIVYVRINMCQSVALLQFVKKRQYISLYNTRYTYIYTLMWTMSTDDELPQVMNKYKVFCLSWWPQSEQTD